MGVAMCLLSVVITISEVLRKQFARSTMTINALTHWINIWRKFDSSSVDSLGYLFPYWVRITFRDPD